MAVTGCQFLSFFTYMFGPPRVQKAEFRLGKGPLAIFIESAATDGSMPIFERELHVKLDEILQLNSYQVLTTKGMISQLVSEQHAHAEYKAFELRRNEEKAREIEAEPDVIAELESKAQSLSSSRKSEAEKS